MKHRNDPDAPLFAQPNRKGFAFRDMARDVRPEVAAVIDNRQRVLDAARAKAERDAAIAAVEQNAEVRYLEAAQQAIRDCADRLPEFTVDDVQALLAERKVAPPREGRAIGAAMKWAVRRGVIESTGEWRASAQPQCHGNPRAVWKKKTGASA